MTCEVCGGARRIKRVFEGDYIPCRACNPAYGMLAKNVDVCEIAPTMFRLKCYYAHSIALYGSKQEERDVETLKALGFDVLNPNTPEHSDGYKNSGQGMLYFRDIVVGCDVLAFRANPEGSINTGIFQEIVYMQSVQKPVIELPSMLAKRCLSIDETSNYLKEQGAR